MDERIQILRDGEISDIKETLKSEGSTFPSHNDIDPRFFPNLRKLIAEVVMSVILSVLFHSSRRKFQESGNHEKFCWRC